MDIYKFWHDVLEQNADAVRDYFDKNADIYWHCTNEHFNVDEFIIANCEYPGSWSDFIFQPFSQLQELYSIFSLHWCVFLISEQNCIKTGVLTYSPISSMVGQILLFCKSIMPEDTSNIFLLPPFRRSSILCPIFVKCSNFIINDFDKRRGMK